jgi:uncharacterized repeat protein (TIGR01451 family)
MHIRRYVLQLNSVRQLLQVLLIGALVAFAALAAPSAALAVGTQAATVSANTATVSYTIGASASWTPSNSVPFTVAEILNVSVAWLDPAPIPVQPGQVNQVATFRVTNTGNGTDTYSLSATSTLGGDDFDPTLVAIYLDTNGNGIYDAGDAAYAPGPGLSLARDVAATIFVLNSIPSTSVSGGNTGLTRLTAASRTGVGAAGTVLAGQGDGGTNAVIGLSGGTSAANASYVINDNRVVLAKSAVVIDPWGGSQPVTGTTIRYTIVATVTGAGTSRSVVVTDPVPANTTYTTGTLRLNSILLTDIADVDAGDVGATTAGAVTVRLGDLTSASPAQTITFDVKIN